MRDDRPLLHVGVAVSLHHKPQGVCMREDVIISEELKKS